MIAISQSIYANTNSSAFTETENYNDRIFDRLSETRNTQSWSIVRVYTYSMCEMKSLII